LKQSTNATSFANPRRWIAGARACARRIDQRLRPAAWRGVGYWERRARGMGERAVLNVGVSDERVSEFTQLQMRTMLPILRDELRGDERLVLDLGCGPGRFTPVLAETIGGRAIGADPVRRLLELAPRHKQVEYLQMAPGQLPLGDNEADVVWVCLVLGGITEPQVLRETALEIDRVLEADGVLLLAECTSAKPDLPYWQYRSVEDYKRMFPRFGLTERGQYMEIDNVVSVLTGRRSAP
jgi:SAM-dependent methyltransferase